MLDLRVIVVWQALKRNKIRVQYMENYASLIGRCGANYLIQVRDAKKPGLSPGAYPFRFPGAASLFGGQMEKSETPESGLRRELTEELPGARIPSSLLHRVYLWRECLDTVLERINETFHGNVNAFLGFDLDAKVPSEAAGKDRDKNLTYRQLIQLIEKDNFYIGELESNALQNVSLGEGSAIRFVPHDIAKSLVMVPSDKLALLDDISRRVLSGELEI